jgi:hypothetical protein
MALRAGVGGLGLGQKEHMWLREALSIAVETTAISPRLRFGQLRWRCWGCKTLQVLAFTLRDRVPMLANSRWQAQMMAPGLPQPLLTFPEAAEAAGGTVLEQSV